LPGSHFATDRERLGELTARWYRRRAHHLAFRHVAETPISPF